jgi:hypothetical protein
MATIASPAGQPPDRSTATTAVATTAPPRTIQKAQRISTFSRRS